MVWFRRPGTASIFVPIEGMAHEWRTSSAVTNTRIVEFIGVTMRWSTSRRRRWPGRRSCGGVM